MNPVLVRVPGLPEDEILVLLGFDSGKAIVCQGDGTLQPYRLEDVTVYWPASDWPANVRLRARP